MKFNAALLIALMVPLCAAKAQSQPPRLEDGWEVGDATALGWNIARFDEAERRIADGTWKGITSLLVAHRGKLVYEAYFNGATRDQVHDTRSLTKTLTAMLVGAAIDRELIDDVQVRAWPWFRDRAAPLHPDARKDAITLEDLLTMSSLLECNDHNAYSAGNEERMYVTEDWIGFVLGLPVKGFPPWERKPADSPHGRAFSYCTGGSFLLGALLERATHKRLDAFSAEVLERPLGIESSRWNFAPDSTAIGGGGTRFRSRDLAKFGELLRNEGQWNGTAILSGSWVRAMLRVHAQAQDDADYGYLIWRFRFPYKDRQQAAWAMSGNGGNYVFVVPELELVSVITSTAYNQGFAHPQSKQIFSDIVLRAMP